MRGRIRLVVIILVLTSVVVPVTVVLGQGGFASWLSVEMSGTSDSYRDIEMSGVSASFLTVDTTWVAPTISLAPTIFIITQTGPNSIIITWNLGPGSNTTIIRASPDGYPTSLTDGYEVYSGNGTSVTMSGFDFGISAHYFSAWGQNTYGYSGNPAQASVGSHIGLPALIFVIGLCVFAFWKKGWIRILLAVCIIIWGAFAIPYDIKIALPLVAGGTLLFMLSIFQVATGKIEEGI
ncbi:MAG: hypothetical protein KAT35_01595 [Candidatus Aenigmarchaeota archaeon]|nr:hypothetical protein [Candidatus Aenigmarchaeota archaeon]